MSTFKVDFESLSSNKSYPSREPWLYLNLNPAFFSHGTNIAFIMKKAVGNSYIMSSNLITGN